MGTDLDHFMTEECIICGHRKVRGLHLEQYCPNDGRHVVKAEGQAKGKAGNRAGQRVYVLLPHNAIYRTGYVVEGPIWCKSRAFAEQAAGRDQQIWSAELLDGSTTGRRRYRLHRFIRYGS